ncbi:MAG: phosphoribosylformimino-5-aminoimidazole carboxamide ribotide isomerase [Planctomycetota bacterium]|nr:phosphoribosylformimino-5-aminoimidazole carboxamide ribotide isomerase [Planctomycetota bacterium]MCX8040003.1 phosphoribosylformimino-5-aminoimidazole carboxamide ribotide isomerase [Planctomycetota bacterium]MDW8372907.1 phosphoribosylformimino-5-aminoimidazole carboxamide ribotide isomerase [Planctomycetota bacterium]
MTLFRPCIDLHGGLVTQIVGGSLRDGERPRTNFVSRLPPEHYAALYRRDELRGGHVIMLGPGNETAARAALAAWPGGLRVGGGITADNARSWLAAGAEKVIVTSWLFPEGRFAPERLAALAQAIGRERLVVDLSCRRQGCGWVVATQRWQRLTDTELSAALFARLAEQCSEFLVHAADVEGLCNGIDAELVECLGRWSPLPVTYAGGARALADLALVEDLSEGRVDLTIGSALDIFGGSGVAYADCVAWNRARARP